MSKNKSIYSVNSSIQPTFLQNNIKDLTEETGNNSGQTTISEIEISAALKVVLQQMKAAGRRDRTIIDYRRHVTDYCKATSHQYLSDVSVQSIYNWLDSMGDVQNSTKLIRLKAFKAFLGKCKNNGWLFQEFWLEVDIKVDKKIKQAATEKDINILLSTMDLSNFFDLRDSTAIMMMYRTGIRATTLALLEERHINIEDSLLNLSGDIMKDHSTLQLPIPPDLSTMITALIQHNNVIRDHFKVNNNLIFITNKGTSIQKSYSSNVIRKRLNEYSKEYGIKNINPHSLRRGFALNLLKKGAPVPLISKALAHDNLEVTSKYLDLDSNTVFSELEKYI